MVTWLRQIEIGPEPLPLAAFAAARGIPSCAADPLIAVRRDAWERMLAHVRSSPDEAGGVLVGSVWRDPASGQTLVDVVAALPAVGAYGSPTYFRFTPAAWDAISRERDVLHPDLLTVGWYHSHPGLGVFYSGTDRAAQRAFFARPWNVGIVIDPADGAYGLFLGAESTPLARSHLVAYAPAPASAPRPSEPAPRRHPEPALRRHPEPAGEGSRLSNTPGPVNRDPSFVRMTKDVRMTKEAARTPEPMRTGPPASWRGRATWAIVILLAVVALATGFARRQRERRR